VVELYNEVTIEYITLGASEEERMLKLLSIKAWMSSKGISKRDRAKIMAHVTSQMDSGATRRGR
jgi:hypothetical protein